MKIVLLSLILISSMFADRDRNIVSAHINGETKIAEVINQKAYYFKCIDGYKWIQFVRVHDQGDINTAAKLVEEEAPVQMYRIANPVAPTITVPVACH